MIYDRQMPREVGREWGGSYVKQVHYGLEKNGREYALCRERRNPILCSTIGDVTCKRCLELKKKQETQGQ